MPDLRCCSQVPGAGLDMVQAPAEGRLGMAQKITVALEDDLSGGPAEETVRFALGGTDYEIDLNSKNAAAFRESLSPFIEHARRAGRAQPRRQ
jgi:hypothetical protein